MSYHWKSFLIATALTVIPGAPLAAQTFNEDYLWGDDVEAYPYSSGVSLDLGDEGALTVDTQVQADGTRDMLLLRVDPDGQLIWSHTYGLAGIDEYGHSLTLSRDREDVVVTGQARNDLWLIRIAIDDGTVVWSNRIGEGSNVERGHFIGPIEDALGSGYVVAGWISNVGRMYMLRIREDGSVVWANQYGIPNAVDIPTSFLVTPDRILVTGLHSQLGFPRSLFVLRLHPFTGLNLDMIFYPHGPLEHARRSAMLAPAGNGFIAAYSVRDPRGARVAVLRLDSTFSVVFENQYTIIDPNMPQANSTGFSWGLSIFPSEANLFSIGTSVTDQNIAGWLSINDFGVPQDARHYQDRGLSVAPMALAEDGFLLKNRLTSSITLTHIDPFGDGPCAVDLDVETVEGRVERIEIPYLIDPYGNLIPHLTPLVEDEPEQLSCP